MNKKRIYLLLFLIIIISFKLKAQGDCGPDGCPDEGGGTVPIPGILYFLFALLGIGIKKLYHARKEG